MASHLSPTGSETTLARSARFGSSGKWAGWRRSRHRQDARQRAGIMRNEAAQAVTLALGRRESRSDTSVDSKAASRPAASAGSTDHAICLSVESGRRRTEGTAAIDDANARLLGIDHQALGHAVTLESNNIARLQR